jgi:hypothetical protein
MKTSTKTICSKPTATVVVVVGYWVYRFSFDVPFLSTLRNKKIIQVE